MGNMLTPAIPSRPPVPTGVTRICLSGFGISHNAGRAHKVAALIAKKYPKDYETWCYYSTFGFKKFLETVIPDFPADQKAKPSTTDKGKTIENHSTSPFVWLEVTKGGVKEYTALGGRDMFCKWVDENFPNDAELMALTKGEPPLSACFFNNKTPGGTYKRAK